MLAALRQLQLILLLLLLLLLDTDTASALEDADINVPPLFKTCSYVWAHLLMRLFCTVARKRMMLLEHPA